MLCPLWRHSGFLDGYKCAFTCYKINYTAFLLLGSPPAPPLIPPLFPGHSLAPEQTSEKLFQVALGNGHLSLVPLITGLLGGGGAEKHPPTPSPMNPNSLMLGTCWGHLGSLDTVGFWPDMVASIQRLVLLVPPWKFPSSPGFPEVWETSRTP